MHFAPAEEDTEVPATDRKESCRTSDFRAAPATDDRFVWLHGELDVWSAFHELRCDLEDRLTLAASRARRGEALRSWTTALLTQLRMNVCRSAGISV